MKNNYTQYHTLHFCQSVYGHPRLFMFNHDAHLILRIWYQVVMQIFLAMHFLIAYPVTLIARF